MESLSDSDVETIVVIEDIETIVLVEETAIVGNTPIPLRRAVDWLRAHSFADDPFVVDWAPPQS